MDIYGLKFPGGFFFYVDQKFSLKSKCLAINIKKVKIIDKLIIMDCAVDREIQLYRRVRDTITYFIHGGKMKIFSVY